MDRLRNSTPGENKAKKIKETIKKLIIYLDGQKKIVVVALLLSSLSSLLNILGPIIMGKATTNIFNAFIGKDKINFDYIGKILLIILILYLLSALFMYIQSYLMAIVSKEVSYNMRRAISIKINHLPMKSFDKKTHGHMLSIVTNDIDNITTTLNQSLPQVVTSFTTIVGVLIMMLIISPLMTLFSLIVIPLSLLLIKGIARQSQYQFKARQDNLAALNGHIEEIYGASNIVRAFNAEDDAMGKFRNYNETLYRASWKAQFLSGLMMPITNFITNISYVVVAVLGGWLALKSIVTVGDIQAFIQYVRSFNMPLTQTAQIANILQSTLASVERVFDFLKTPNEPLDIKHPVKLDHVNGDVEFKNVKFGYDLNKIIIYNFSLKVKKGQHIAIVGHTGAGKSTLIKLMMRFYDLTSGEILIDNHDIKSFSRSDLRSMFGIVLQDAWLFNDTIMENIRYGNLNATDNQVIAAAKAAFADDFIKSLPGGYDMIINEEANNLSQGQMQLITIARAFLSDPDILVLDEATSSVDTRTEQLIQEAMYRLMKGKTAFIIAHRLSTIKNADNILVLDQGDVIEQGRHEELLEKDGFYKKLYDSQFDNM